MRNTKRIGWTILAVALVVGCEPQSAPPPSDSVRVGAPAPEIHGKDADGVAFQLSDYRGKVVLLDFWGYW